VQFVKATKRQSFARVALVGPPGAGKTYSALRIMKGLLPEGARLAVIDTERGSASKYSDIFDFDVLELPSFEPDTYVKALYAATDAGYAGVVLDSLSHAWMGKGGALEQVDNKSKAAGSSFNAWRDVTPQHNRLVDAMLTYPGHLIVTMRVKTEYVVEQVTKNGRTTSVPRKVGLAPVQRDGLEYEFDVVGDLNAENALSITKTRCSALNGALVEQPGEEMGATLRAWLTDGAEAAPLPKRPALPSAPQKLPAQKTAPPPPAKQEQKPAPPPFDITKAMMAMARATTEAELGKLSFEGASEAQKETIRQVFKGRVAEIRQAAQPANDSAPAPEAAAATESAAATDSAVEAPAPAPTEAAPPVEEAPPADPGWDAGLAAIAALTGYDTASWSADDLLAAWHDELQRHTDRKTLPAELGPWLTALKSKQDGSIRLRQVVVQMSAMFNARMKELRDSAPAAQQAAGGAA
jgi:hypothetical protein